MRPRRIRETVAALTAVLATAGVARAQPAPGGSSSPAPAPATGDAAKDDARGHFDLGISHFDREEWAAALVEFLKSRELFPTKGNTKNAAICLRKVGRFDEALDLFEALLRDFSDLSPTDHDLAQRDRRDPSRRRRQCRGRGVRRLRDPRCSEISGAHIPAPARTADGAKIEAGTPSARRSHSILS